MKKLILLLFLTSSILWGQGIYFEFPTSSTVLTLDRGEIMVFYNMYSASDLVVYNYYAKLTHPDGTQTNWMIGEEGGWPAYQPGQYQIQGKADVASIYGGAPYTAYRPAFSFQINGYPNQALNCSIDGATVLTYDQSPTYNCGAIGGSWDYIYQWQIMKIEGDLYSTSATNKRMNENSFSSQQIIINALPSGYWYDIGVDSPNFTLDPPNNGDYRNFQLRCIVTDTNGNQATSNILSIQYSNNQ